MNKKRYLLKIYLKTVMIQLEFNLLDDLYLFLFSLHSINDIIIFMVWDQKDSHLLDVLTKIEDK